MLKGLKIRARERVCEPFAKSANSDSCVLNFDRGDVINEREFSVTNCDKKLIDYAYVEDDFDQCVPKYKKCNVPDTERRRIRLPMGNMRGRIV